MTLPAWAMRFGFDAPRLTYALRTAFASCLALLVAWLIGLEHPQWSAMTVWAASQPLRGQLLEKSFFRFAGTIIGVIVGIILVVMASDRLIVLVIGLALWIGFCAGLGNVQRGFLSYGTMLAGYSAAMVALLDTAHPDHIFALGADRLLTVLVGVVVALAVGWLLTPAHDEEAVAARVRRLSACIFRAMAARLRGEPSGTVEEQRALLSEMAAIEGGLDPHGAGSLRSRRSVRSIRALLAAQVAALLWLRGATSLPVEKAASAALDEAAAMLEAPSGNNGAVAAMERAADLSASPTLHEAVLKMETALRDFLGAAQQNTERPQPRFPVVLHRDWIGAREAMIRAASAMLLMGALWVVTGLSVGPYLLLGTAIMTSVFSTFDNPSQIMRSIMLGQVLGAIGALTCRWLVWPFASNEIELVLLIMPFIVLGTPLFSHPRTTLAAIDYNMVMLLLLQPAFPLTQTFGQSLAIVIAVVAGPTAAFVAYRLIYPATARRRMNTLIAMMVHELQDMAAPNASTYRTVWQARLYHRLLRLVRWTEKTGEREISVTAGSLAVLELGNTVLRIQELLREPDVASGTQRSLKLVLQRMRNIGREPERVARALDLAAARLSGAGRADADLIASAGRALMASLGFFQRASRPD